MAHFVSQPLIQAYATPGGAQRRSALLTLPDPYDTRYPRPIWLRALRLAASAWWTPLAVYVSQAVTLVAATEQAARFAAPLDGGLVARALRIDWVPTFVVEQPAGLLVRLARPEERLDAAFVQRALAPALAWRLRTARVRRRAATLVVGLAALGLGVALGLGALPPGS